MPDVAMAMQCIETLPPCVEVAANKAYDAHAVRAWLDERGTTAVIPPRRHRGVQYAYDKRVYATRHVMERMFCRLNDWRRLRTRYGGNVSNLLATVTVAAIVSHWL